jgi:hypothetical protein
MMLPRCDTDAAGLAEAAAAAPGLATAQCDVAAPRGIEDALEAAREAFGEPVSVLGAVLGVRYFCFVIFFVVDRDSMWEKSSGNCSLLFLFSSCIRYFFASLPVGQIGGPRSQQRGYRQ